MDGTPLAKIDDVAVWFPGVPVTDEKLVEALVEASNRFRAAVRHYVSAEERDVVLDGGGSMYLSLPSMNVEPDTISCEIDGVDVPVRVSRVGLIRRADGEVFPLGLGNVRCAYSAGHPDDAIPPEIQAVVVDVAKVLYALKRGIQWLAVGGMSMSVNATDATGVTQAWTDTVELHRIRRADRA